MSRSHTFYSWARDKPCTTNSIYGWTLRSTVGAADTNTGKELTRREAKHNLSGELTTRSKADLSGFQRNKKTCEICLLEPSSINKFNINRGYVTGYVPVKDKIARKSAANEKRMSKSHDTITDQSEDGSGKDLCLWHSLSGTLVHCPDYSTKTSTTAEVY